MEKLQWYKLKENKCPKLKCRGSIGVLDQKTLKCSNSKCDFKISVEKFQKICVETQEKILKKQRTESLSLLEE